MVIRASRLDDWRDGEGHIDQSPPGRLLPAGRTHIPPAYGPRGTARGSAATYARAKKKDVE